MEIIDSDKLVDILAGDGDELWGTSVLEDLHKPNSVCDAMFDAMAAAGKRLDMEEVPRNNRVIKMWTLDDKTL
jgi:hypothetical protein